jgi:hypothetical protein
MYWDDVLNQLFIYYSNGGSPVWVQAAPSASGGGGGTVTSVSGSGPISVATPNTTPVISIAPATTTTAGSLSGADKTKIDALPLTIVSSVTGTAPIVVASGTTTPVVSITAGTARQLLQTNAGGTAAEFASNIDIPGTLDVTGAAVFDNTVTVAGTHLQLQAQGDLRFADADSSNYVAFQAPATVAADVTWTLPAVDGTSGQVLSTNGTGTLSWASSGGSTGSVTAWANFNGIAGAAIRGSANISSITETSIGLYQVSFSSALANANYAVVFGLSVSAAFGSAIVAQVNEFPATAQTTSGFRFFVVTGNSSGLAESLWTNFAVIM